MTANDMRAEARQIEARRRKTLTYSLLAAGIVLVGVLLAIAIHRVSANKAAPYDVATPAAGDGIAVAVQTDKNAPRLDIYYDYACSHCAHLDAEYHEALETAAQAGKLDLRYHPVAVMGTPFSDMGAIAENWAAENAPEAYLAFRTALHDRLVEPVMNGERETYPDTSEFVQIALDLGLDEASVAKLKESLDYTDESLAGQVIKDSKAFIDAGYTGTPTVLVAGQNANDWSAAIDEVLEKVQ